MEKENRGTPTLRMIKSSLVFLLKIDWFFGSIRALGNCEIDPASLFSGRLAGKFRRSRRRWISSDWLGIWPIWPAFWFYFSRFIPSSPALVRLLSLILAFWSNLIARELCELSPELFIRLGVMFYWVEWEWNLENWILKGFCFWVVLSFYFSW